MDVGLNNRNTLVEVDKSLADVVFLVEANSNETFELWKDWSKESVNNIKPLKENDFRLIQITMRNYPTLLEEITKLNNAIKEERIRKVNWKQIMQGLTITIGQVNHGKDVLPICLSIQFAFINGKKVAFYHCCSRAGDSKLVEDWFKERFQLTHDGYTRWNHVDANNFHNCVDGLNRLDKEPRNTKYKKS